jgi:hypothetical protein
MTCGDYKKQRPQAPDKREDMHMTDTTGQARRAMIASGQPAADLAADEGRRWTTEEMTAEFEVLGFAAPFAVVRRRSDGQLGSLEFMHRPRIYFGFVADDGR